MSDLILYTTDDGRSQIRLRTDQQTVWLTQLEMAELFDATKQNISLHLKNIFEDRELDPATTVKESLTVHTEGARQVQRPVALYNLDAILAVGYRVRSPAVRSSAVGRQPCSHIGRVEHLRCLATTTRESFARRAA